MGPRKLTPLAHCVYPVNCCQSAVVETVVVAVRFCRRWCSIGVKARSRAQSVAAASRAGGRRRSSWRRELVGRFELEPGRGSWPPSNRGVTNGVSSIRHFSYSCSFRLMYISVQSFACFSHARRRRLRLSASTSCYAVSII